MDFSAESDNHIPIPPGMTIAEQIADRGITEEDLSLALGITHERLRMLLRGETELDETLADGLQSALGIPSRFWLKMESMYRQEQEEMRAELIAPAAKRNFVDSRF